MQAHRLVTYVGCNGKYNSRPGGRFELSPSKEVDGNVEATSSSSEFRHCNRYAII